MTNKLCSKPFPLSTLMESTEEIWNIYRVSLYADDLLLYISDPVPCASDIVKMLDQFGSFSGYKLNVFWSIIHPLQLQSQPCPSLFLGQDLNIWESMLPVIYLVFMTKMLPWLTILKLTSRSGVYKICLWQAKLRVLKWTYCPNVYIRFRATLSSSQNLFSDLFLWGNKHPKVYKVLLQRHRAKGGLALPNLMYYH